MIRYYYLTNDLDGLEAVEKDLIAEGITDAQVHVYSDDDASVMQRKLHGVSSFLKRDLYRSTRKGMYIGVAGAVLVLLLTWLFNWADTPAGWIPFVFLALILLGFGAWEGGLIGIGTPNTEFKSFQRALNRGKHILFLDIKKSQEETVRNVIRRHRKLKFAGTGEADPAWVVKSQETVQDIARSGP